MSPLADLQTRPVELRNSRNFVVIAAAVALLAAFALMGRLVQSPGFVSQVTFVNRTHFDLNAAASGGSPGGGVLIDTAQPAQTTVVNDVIDQGDTWTFTFTRAGTTIGVLRMSRSDLAAHHWQVVIPTSFETTLYAHGQLPPP
jgi:hypothetical protein